jgi:predicted type IV restriction endonuclease
MTRWKVKRAICTDGDVWIVRDTLHPWGYLLADDEQDAVAQAIELNTKAEIERREREAAAKAECERLEAEAAE